MNRFFLSIPIRMMMPVIAASLFLGMVPLQGMQTPLVINPNKAREDRYAQLLKRKQEIESALEKRGKRHGSDKGKEEAKAVDDLREFVDQDWWQNGEQDLANIFSAEKDLRVLLSFPEIRKEFPELYPAPAGLTWPQIGVAVALGAILGSAIAWAMHAVPEMVKKYRKKKEESDGVAKDGGPLDEGKQVRIDK